MRRNDRLRTANPPLEGRKNLSVYRLFLARWANRQLGYFPMQKRTGLELFDRLAIRGPMR